MSISHPPLQNLRNYVLTDFSIPGSSIISPNRKLKNAESNKENVYNRSTTYRPARTAETTVLLPRPQVDKGNSRLTDVKITTAQRKLIQFMNHILVCQIPQFVSIHLASCPSTPGYYTSSDDSELENEEFQPFEDSGPPKIEYSTPKLASSPRHPGYVSPCSLEMINDTSLASPSICSISPGGGKFVNSSETSTPGYNLPVEILLKIFLNINDVETMIATSQTCKIIRYEIMKNEVWKEKLADIALECNIDASLLTRKDTTPTHLRYRAILRWKETFLEMRSILNNLCTPNLNPDLIFDLQRKFEFLFDKLMPNVVPWDNSRMVEAKFEVQLPSNIRLLEMQGTCSTKVFIDIEDGIYRKEFDRLRLDPVVEFEVSLLRPIHSQQQTWTVKCCTKDIYHPQLDQSNGSFAVSQEIFNHQDSGLDFPPSETFQAIVFYLQRCFTDIKCITSTFDL